MDTLKQERLDELVDTLGMRRELAPLFEYDAGYERFESAVQQCIERHIEGWKNRKFMRYAMVMSAYSIAQYRRSFGENDIGGWIWCRPFRGKVIEDRLRIEESVHRYEKQDDGTFVAEIRYGEHVTPMDAELFKHYFGISCVPELYADIVTKRERGPRSRNPPHDTRNRINRFVDFLRVKNRCSIWYGTLPIDGDGRDTPFDGTRHEDSPQEPTA